MENRYTNEQLCGLIRKDRSGWALNQLISQNECFICSIANRLFAKQSKSQRTALYDLDDLIQEGRIAVMKAAEKYDVTENAKFLSFAGRVIYNALLDYVKKMQDETKENVSLDVLPEYEQDLSQALPGRDLAVFLWKGNPILLIHGDPSEKEELFRKIRGVVSARPRGQQIKDIFFS